MLYRNFAEAMRQNGMAFSYLKSTRGQKTPDYLLDHEGEGPSQFKGVAPDRKLILAHGDRSDGIHRPLFLLGYLG